MRKTAMTPRSAPMPARTAPMRRGEPMGRGKPPERRAGLHRVRINRPRVGIDPVWTAVRAVVWARCGGRDEYTGERLDPETWQAHHRLFRSRGGQHSAANAVALTPANHAAVHQMEQLAAKARGFVVPRGTDPAGVSIRLYDGRLVRLTTDGTYVPTTPREGS